MMYLLLNGEGNCLIILLIEYFMGSDWFNLNDFLLRIYKLFFIMFFWMFYVDLEDILCFKFVNEWMNF